MGCCTSRPEEQQKAFASPNIEVERLPHEDEPWSVESLKSPSLSLREVLNKPLKAPANFETQTASTPLLNPIIPLQYILPRQGRFTRFEATFPEDFEAIPLLENFKTFEVDILTIESPSDFEALDFLDKLRPFMRKNIENMVFIFNYELASGENFVIKPMLHCKKTSKVNPFRVFVFKEFMNTPFQDFIRDHANKPGLFEENLLVSLLFNLSRILLGFRKNLVEFEDLCEEYFAFDGKGLGHMKFDPTMRLFLQKSSENATKPKDSAVFSLARLILKLALGKEIREVDKPAIFEENQEILSIKYPKLWYFLEKMLEDNAEARISLESLCEKRDFIESSLESTSFLQCFIGVEKEPDELEDFDRRKGLIEGNIGIFQYFGALKLIKETIEGFYKQKVPVFDARLAELREKKAEIHITLEEWESAREEYDFLDKFYSVSTGGQDKSFEAKYKLAFCYKNLGKWQKSLSLLQGLAATPSGSLIAVKASILMAEIYQERGDFIESKLLLDSALKSIRQALQEHAKTLEAIGETTTPSNRSTEYEDFAKSIEENEEVIHRKSQAIQLADVTKGPITKVPSKTHKADKLKPKKPRKKEDFTHYSPQALLLKTLEADVLELLSRYFMLHEENYVEALDLMKSVLRIRKPIFSSEALIMVRSFKFLSLCYLNVGELKDALKSINKNLSLLKTLESLSPFPLRLRKLQRLQAESLKVRSKVEFELGEVEKAEKTYKEVLEIYEEADGFYSPGLVRELQGLAGFYSTCSWFNKALETLRIAAETIKGVFGERSEEMARNWYLMGEFYEDNGKYSEGVDAFLECLTRRLEIHGGLNGKMVDLLVRISKSYEFLGFHSKACEYGEKALELMREKLHLQAESPRTRLSSTPKKKKPGSPMKVKKAHSAKLREDKLLLEESLFRLGGLYKKMGMLAKSRDYFNEEKRVSALDY